MSNHRKSPRAPFLHYEHGDYFVTICTKGMKHYFGEICNKKMILSDIGEIAERELNNVAPHQPHVVIPLFVVMPNHIHAVITIEESRDVACHVTMGGILQRNPNPSYRSNPDVARHVPTLSIVIGSFKSAVSRKAHLLDSSFAWQERYHDHQIRGTKDGRIIGEYILNNVLRWDKDCFYTTDNN